MKTAFTWPGGMLLVISAPLTTMTSEPDSATYSLATM